MKRSPLGIKSSEIPTGETSDLLHPIQDAILSTAYTGVHSVHIVHKKKEKLSIESIFSIVSITVAHETLENKRGRRLKK